MGSAWVNWKQKAQDGETSIDKIIESLERKASVDQNLLQVLPLLANLY